MKKIFFDQPVNNIIGNRTETITDCLLNFMKNYYNMIAILSKQQALDADLQINFTGKLDRAAGATIFFIVEKVK